MRVMRVLVAPDSFGGTLSAAEAAAAIAAGFRAVVGRVDVRIAPLSDGGPGFVDVLADATGGGRRTQTVRGPLGDPVTADVLVVGDTGYVEAAQAAGLHLVAETRRDPRRASSYGVGELLVAAAAGVRRVVVGLGGTATNDGGAGMWAALGAQPEDRLAAGGGALAGLTEVLPPHPLLASLVVATDVDNPLLGPNGASAVYGPQKGADREAVLDLDDALRRWADVVEASTVQPGLRDRPGAGAGGGLGFGLLALGASLTSGFEVVAGALDLPGKVAGVDLVVTGEGSVDAQSLRGKVVVGVARLAQDAGVPCVVVAGRAAVGRRDAAAAGVDDIEAVADLLGSADAARAAGAAGVERAAAAIARRWARPGIQGPRPT
jgi:glycerate 2-kinase